MAHLPPPRIPGLEKVVGLPKLFITFACHPSAFANGNRSEFHQPNPSSECLLCHLMNPEEVTRPDTERTDSVKFRELIIKLSEHQSLPCKTFCDMSEAEGYCLKEGIQPWEVVNFSDAILEDSQCLQMLYRGRSSPDTFVPYWEVLVSTNFPKITGDKATSIVCQLRHIFASKHFLKRIIGGKLPWGKPAVPSEYSKAPEIMRPHYWSSPHPVTA
jgi:hypothetical protein